MTAPGLPLHAGLGLVEGQLDLVGSGVPVGNTLLDCVFWLDIEGVSGTSGGRETTDRDLAREKSAQVIIQEENRKTIQDSDSLKCTAKSQGDHELRQSRRSSR